VNFSTEPPLSEIGPDVTVAKMIFSLTEKGDAVDGLLSITLDSPQKNTGLSTDFPIVEGTRLIETQVQTKNGKFEMSYLFPIRGDYKMTVRSKVDGKEYTEVLDFKLNENPHEVAKFGILLLSLLVFGLISGVVIGRGATLKAQSSEEIASLVSEDVRA
ncbi:MAG: hypothetical protein NE330_15575, partial [Lentisphaeraceae bacterium]|nr:hypothetical protein [Lentisphaeraceae bacterium]